MMKSPIPEQIEKSAQTYSELMGEVKRRIDTMRHMASPAFFEQMPGGIAMECCYLQLRMVTELIALACLTAHGTAPRARSRSIRKETSADAIMNSLDKIHPDFYPIPEQQIRDENGGWLGSNLRMDGFIKRRELTAVYGTCGNVLHIGNFNQISERKPSDLDHHIPYLNKTISGIVGLLQWHTIVTVDPSIQFWIEMAPSDGGVPGLKLVHIPETTPGFFAELSLLRSQVDRHG
jgi:hypothetical protein